MKMRFWTNLFPCHLQKNNFLQTQICITLWPILFQKPFAILSFIFMCFHFLWHNTPHYEIHAASICLSCVTTCLSVLRGLIIYSVRCTHHLSAASLLLFGFTPIREKKEGVLVYQLKPLPFIKSDTLVTGMDTTRTRNWQHFSHYFHHHYWREMSTLSW